MMVVVILLHVNCFAQYALCGLNLGYKRSDRPAIGVAICVSFAIAAPAVAGVYTIISPLGRDYSEMEKKNNHHHVCPFMGLVGPILAVNISEFRNVLRFPPTQKYKVVNSLRMLVKTHKSKQCIEYLIIYFKPCISL